MSLWDDIAAQGAQAGALQGPGQSIYAGLSPEQALQRWHSIQQQIKSSGLQPGQRGPGGEILGSMETLAQQNPEAFKLVASGKDRVKQEGTDTRKVFNTQTGQWDTQDVKGWWSRPESWLQLGLGAAGGVGAASALSGGGAAAGGAAGGSGAAAGGTAPAVAGAAPAAAGGAAAAGGGVGSWLPYAIGAGTSLAQGLIGSRAANTASRQQQEAAQRAIGVLQPIYHEQRAYEAPYASVGYGALGNLAQLSGMPRPNPAPYPFSPYSSSNVPMSSLGQPYANPYAPRAQQRQPEMVTLRAPDGSTRQFPADQAQHYIQLGAQRVG